MKNILKNINKNFLSIFGREMKIVTTFNGIGAFSHALKILGVEVGEQTYCEIDEDANKTYIANNKFKLVSFVDDIRELLTTVKRGEKMDMLIQTPPCQSFSSQNNSTRSGLNSQNGNLFLTAINLQKKVDSSIVVYENVKGLISHEKFVYTYKRANGEQFSTKTKISKKKLQNKNLTLISKDEYSFQSLINKTMKVGFTLHTIENLLLEDTRYNYYWKIVNSADQGLPQNRERIFIIGIKKELDKGFEFPKSIGLKFTAEDILESNVDQSYYFNSDKDLELKVSNQTRRKNKIHNFGHFPDVKYKTDARVSFPYVAPTITTGNNNLFTINGSIRKLTQNENKKILGFSNDFILIGSKTTQNKQLGNTVSPGVYVRLIESLAKALKPANSNTIYIKRSLSNKYQMNYLNIKEDLAHHYLDFIENGGKVIVQVDLYNNKEDKKTNINYETYFINISDLQMLGFSSKKSNTRRFRIIGDVTKHIFAYDKQINRSKIVDENMSKDFKTQLFNKFGKSQIKRLNIVSLINHKNQKVRDYLKRMDTSVYSQNISIITSNQMNNIDFMKLNISSAS